MANVISRLRVEANNRVGVQGRPGEAGFDEDVEAAGRAADTWVNEEFIAQFLAGFSGDLGFPGGGAGLGRAEQEPPLIAEPPQPMRRA